ncbi:MAG: hypothetical protein JNM55_16070 [Anaerolineales bacterium]|nr:hypothetical protein [Anaerolineales bacterium]
MRPVSSIRQLRYLPKSRFALTDEQQEVKAFFSRFFLAAIFHVVLALLLYRFRPALPTVYVILVFLVGLSTLRDKTPIRLVYICTYIASAELLWRMTKADVFWETGKYLLVLLMVLGAVRWQTRLQGIGILYFSLLVPGVVITLSILSFDVAQEQISFNLSGPLALAIAVAFLGGVQLNQQQAGKMLLIGLLPVISISTLVWRSTLTAERIAFITESNFITSGGYGPNQISAILSLGALFSMLYLFIALPLGIRWWIIMGISSILLLQSVLTFSRGGLLDLIFAIPAAMFFFTQNGGREMRRLLVLTVILAILAGWAIPNLNQYTGGALQARYEELDTTGRVQLIQADLQDWQENPIFGVGVSLSSVNRGLILGGGYIDVAAHTEYSRLLAEHGMFGVAAILLLVVIVLRGLRRAKTGLAKGMLAGLMVWSLVEMTHSAMRISAVAYIFALPIVVLSMDGDN